MKKVISFVGLAVCLSISLLITSVTSCQQTSIRELEPPPIPTEAPTGPKFEVTILEVTPQEIVAGDQVYIAAWVENIGNEFGSCEMIITVNGVPVEREWLTLQPGQNKKIACFLEYSQQVHFATTSLIDVEGVTVVGVTIEGYSDKLFLLNREQLAALLAAKGKDLVLLQMKLGMIPQGALLVPPEQPTQEWGFLLPQQIAMRALYKKVFQDDEGLWKRGSFEIRVGESTTMGLGREPITLPATTTLKIR